MMSVFYDFFLKIKKRTCFFLSLILILPLPLIQGCQNAAINPVTVQGFYFDTVVSLTFYENDLQKADMLKQECMKLMQLYEDRFSRTKKGSDIWNINHSKGAPVTVSTETILLLEKALYYAELSDGLVDPTIGTLSCLWNFGTSNEKKIPSKEEIQAALSHVDYQTVKIQENQVTLADPEAIIDLGFIAKGYIADLLKEYLQSQNVQSAIINLGGNVLTIGSKPDGSPFQIGIQKPFSDTGTALLSLPVVNQSLVSSGNYERYFIKDRTVFHHILSTRTGYPADSDLSQVTIISNSSVDGDALSTLCFILGSEKGHSLINSIPDTEAVFVTSDNQIIKTF